MRYRPWTAATGSVVLGAPVPGLLELLPAAPPTPFRVRLELRQEDSFNLFGDVGLYFAHGQRETTQGPLHLFARACYADLGPLADGAKGPRGERGGWLRLQMYSLLEVPEGPPRTFRYTGRGGKAFHVPPDPGQPPGPWRTLTVDVKATEVRAALDAHTVRIDWTKESAYWLKGLKEENGDVHPPDIHLDLAGGMGIYLYGCSVSLRRLSIEPLLAGAE